MAGNESTAKITLDLDNAEFVKRMRESLGLVRDIGDSENLSGIVQMFLKVGSLAAVAAGAVAVFKTTLDTALEGEKLIALEKNFENLAKSIGVAADTMRDDLVTATRGLIDDTDLIEMATKAMVKLGDESGKIPRIMELASKATAIFGGSLADNFNNLVTAVETGNARMLRQYGITVDSEKAVKAYAKQLGISVELLSEQGRRTALSNAIMDQASEKFKNLTAQSMPATNALAILKNSFADLGDTIAKITAARTGGFFADLAGGLGLIAKGLKAGVVGVFGSELDKIEGRIANVRAKMEANQKALESMSGKATPGLEAFRAQEIEATKKQQDQLRQELAALEGKSDTIKKQSGLAAENSAITTAAHNKTLEQIEAEKNARSIAEDKKKEKVLAFTRDILNAQREAILEREANLTSAAEAELNLQAQQVLIAEDFELKKSELKKKYEQDKFLSAEQYGAMMENLDIARNERLAALEEQLQDRRIAAMERAASRAETLSQGIQAGFAVEGAKAAKEFNDMGARGQRAFQIIGNNAAQAFIQMGAGTKDAGEAMRMFMFGAIADIAEAEGKLLLMKGIGTYNPVAVAQGAGLLALSGLLRSMAGGGAKGLGGAGEGGAGGGAMAGGAVGADLSSRPAVSEPSQGKSVTIQIHGSYFETDQTRTRLMEMIRESGDFTDFNLKKIGQY